MTGTASSAPARPGRWVEPLARAGFAAKGGVYALVAVIAVKVAAGAGGKPEDQRGALGTLADEPFGMVLLVLLGLGLAAYAAWRLAQVFLGARGKHGFEDLGERAASVGRAGIYAALAFFAWSIVAGDRASGSAEQQQTATVLGWPGGVVLVTAVGVVVIGVAAYQAYRAATQDFLDDLDLAGVGGGERRAATLVGTIGHAARAVVFGLIGVFLVKAAVGYDPEDAVGLDGALRELASQPYGRYLLGLVAAGLFLFALYCLVEARYRRL
ncbi:MAG: DUF1206 domain-containing protein [Actinomycetota bacterium]|nr:DUF1206 domain-containing protein [Actinomycetota bacterium]